MRDVHIGFASTLWQRETTWVKIILQINEHYVMKNRENERVLHVSSLVDVYIKKMFAQYLQSNSLHVT